MALTVDDLPREVLSRIIAGCGLITASHAACTCKRLHAVQRMLQKQEQLQVFAGAGSRHPDLHQAIKDSARRACEGMQGGVDFAVLLVSYHYPSGLDDQPGTGPAHVLQQFLPQGVPVVGCLVDGVISVSSNYDIMDTPPVPPQLPHGVAVLLGRMPGYQVMPFVDCTDLDINGGLRKTKKKAVSTPEDAAMLSFTQCLGGSSAGKQQPAQASTKRGQGQRVTASPQDCPQPELVWLFPTSSGYEAASGLMDWLNHTYQGKCVVSGGIAGTSGTIDISGPEEVMEIFLAPGPGFGSHIPHWKPSSVADVGYVGLAMCRHSQPAGHTSSAASTSGDNSLAAGPSDTSVLPAHAAARPAGIKAACGMLHGMHEVDRKEVVHITRLEHSSDGWLVLSGRTPARSERHSGRSLGHLVTHTHTYLNPVGLAIWVQENEDGKGQTAASRPDVDDMTGSGGAAGCFSYHSLQKPGQVFQLVMDGLHQCETSADQPETIVCALPNLPDSEAYSSVLLPLSQALESGAQVRAQFLSIQSQGYLEQLPHILQVLDAACSPVADSSQQWLEEVYDALKRNAEGAGATSGRSALGVFTCNGRPQLLTGRKHCMSEAELMDTVLQQKVPFIGGYFGGEIGSPLVCSWTSFSFTPAALQNLHKRQSSQRDCSPLLAACIEAGQGPSSLVPHACALEAYTSVYSMVGAW